MADVHSKETRSYNMSRIRSKDTKPEMLVRKFLHKTGFRYRLQSNNLPGKPDIILKKYKTIIFINGCFWHGHQGCRYFVIPKSRIEYWTNKITGNMKRDVQVYKELEQLGWKVIIIWECRLKKAFREEELNYLKNIKNELYNKIFYGKLFKSISIMN